MTSLEKFKEMIARLRAESLAKQEEQAKKEEEKKEEIVVEQAPKKRGRPKKTDTTAE